MTPQQKIKQLILFREADLNESDTTFAEALTADEVDEYYDNLVAADCHWDALEEVRGSGTETGLPCEYSRHYESKSVACLALDGTWVGWTYWYGGGKHGEPEAIDWIEHAYDVAVTEEEKLVTVRTFAKVEP